MMIKQQKQRKGNPQQNEQVQLPKCEDLISPIPFMSRVLYFAIFALWLIDLVSGFGKEGIGQLYMSNKWSQTVGSWQLWRLITSLLYCPSLLLLILFIMNTSTFFPKIETRCSTPAFMLQLLLTNILVQLVALPIQYMFSQIIPFTQEHPMGLCGVWFNLMFKFCFYNKAEIKMCCCDVKIPRVAYPFVFAPILCLIYWQVMWDILAGILLAVLESVLIRRNATDLPSSVYERVDSCCPCAGSESWVPYHSNTSFCHPINNIYSSLEQEPFMERKILTDGSPATSSNSDYFSNKKGYSLQ